MMIGRLGASILSPRFKLMGKKRSEEKKKKNIELTDLYDYYFGNGAHDHPTGWAFWTGNQRPYDR